MAIEEIDQTKHYIGAIPDEAYETCRIAVYWQETDDGKILVIAEQEPIWFADEVVDDPWEDYDVPVYLSLEDINKMIELLQKAKAELA